MAGVDIDSFANRAGHKGTLNIETKLGEVEISLSCTTTINLVFNVFFKYKVPQFFSSSFPESYTHV